MWGVKWGGMSMEISSRYFKDQHKFGNIYRKFNR